jgi:dolichyl-phosphate beta-glucosyltransferase
MAVRTGVLAAHTEFALFSDVDEAVPIGEAMKLLEAAVAENADVAIGTRYHPGSVITKRQPWPRIAVSRAGNLLVRALALPGLKDTQCGFKLFRTATMRAVMERVSIAGFGFDLEVLAIARAWGRKIIEVPVTWAHGEGSTLRLGRAAWAVLKDLLRITWRLRTGAYGKDG